MGRVSLHLIYEMGKVGIISGLISGILILAVFAEVDGHLQLMPWAFYTMIGLAVGLHGLQATVFGVLAHMLTAMTIGASFCICSSLHPVLRLGSAWKGLLAGGLTGLEVYAIFFLPITQLLVLPAIHSLPAVDFAGMTSNSNAAADVLGADLPVIIGGALALHVLFGSVMGIYSSVFIPEKFKIRKSPEA